jgi:hypothetical protein
MAHLANLDIGKSTMKIHLTPTLFLRGDHQVSLNRFRIDAFNLDLKSNDLKINRPYPNLNHIVGHSISEKKNTAGLLFETQSIARKFDSESIWLVDGVEILHVVKYDIIDEDFDAVSDQMIYWYAFANDANKHFQSRIPIQYCGTPPLEIQPKMEYKSTVFSHYSKDTLNDENYIIKRVNTLSLPTLESDRLTVSDKTTNHRCYPRKLLTGY